MSSSVNISRSLDSTEGGLPQLRPELTPSKDGPTLDALRAQLQDCERTVQALRNENGRLQADLNQRERELSRSSATDFEADPLLRKDFIASDIGNR